MTSLFSHQQIEHFRAFGYVVLHGLLTHEETGRLTAEVTAGLTDAYGGLGTDTDPYDEGGIRGDYLPLAADRTPFSQSLIADDPRLFQGSAELCGRMTVPAVPSAVCFTTNSGWHTDVGPDVPGVTFLAHLEPRTAQTGALRVLSGSHDPAYARRLAAYRGLDPANQGFSGWPMPETVLPTRPGDVLAFDVHLLHRSAGGANRLAWRTEYLGWPGLGDADGMRVVRELLTEDEYEDAGFDRVRWPEWDEWAAGAAGIASRQTALDRLRLLGAVPGARTAAEGGAGPDA
ncbi:phytanoyl-CoA dioxygenase family protein [Streptomyces phytophilus]|uniref:phytanoyl-CoA dioxygenase family protein n=1 Tax=Streptomyces phytophilus TaxID=722715 RepID=UPI0015F11DF3|nr:phytanoyl-CoA dioxygenase family protein [Streptomyces phytophilus]